MRRLVLCLLVLPGLAVSAPVPSDTQLPAAWRPIAREIFAELIQIDSTHEKGSTAAAHAIARRLRAAGFPEADLTLAGPLPHKQNLVVRLRGTGKARPRRGSPSRASTSRSAAGHPPSTPRWSGRSRG